MTQATVFNAGWSCEKARSHHREAGLFSAAWWSNEVIDFLPRMGLIHMEQEAQMMF